MSISLRSPSAGSTIVSKLKIHEGGTNAITVEESLTNLSAIPIAQLNQPGGVAGVTSQTKVLNTVLSLQTIGTKVLGPTTAYVNETISFTIKNYDIATTYELAATNGSLNRTVDSVEYTAPATPGIYTININGRDLTITVLAIMPNAPIVTSPIDNATELTAAVSFTSSAFSTNTGSDTHEGSDWQIATDMSFTTIVSQVTNSATNKLSYNVTSLNSNTTYYVRVRYKGTTYGYGNWSNYSTFSTKLYFGPSTEIAKISASDRLASDLFGVDTAIDSAGTRIAVGSRGADINNAIDSGSIYLFNKSGTNLTQTNKILSVSEGHTIAYNVAATGSLTIQTDGLTPLNNPVTGNSSIVAGTDARVITLIGKGGNGSQGSNVTVNGKNYTRNFSGNLDLAGPWGGYNYPSPAVTYTNNLYVPASFLNTMGIGYNVLFNSFTVTFTVQSGMYPHGQLTDQFSTIDAGWVCTVTINHYLNTNNKDSHMQETFSMGSSFSFNNGQTLSSPQGSVYIPGYWASAMANFSSNNETTTYYDIPGANTTVTINGQVHTFTGGANGPANQSTITHYVNSYDLFGHSIALSGDGLVLAGGSPHDNTVGLSDSGSVSVSRYVTGAWQLPKFVKPSDPATNDKFGTSVALDITGTRMVVGSPYSDPGGVADAGAAYVFLRSGDTWTQEAKLLASDRLTNDWFGHSVDINEDGSRIAVGAFYGDKSGAADSGTVYIFSRSGTTWTQEAELTASNAANYNAFGVSVSFNSDATRIVVGAYNSSPAGITYAGAAYIYIRSGTTWTEEAILTASDKVTSDIFGYSVSMNDTGDTVAIGAPWNNVVGVADAGAVYTFVRTGTTWTQDKKLIASDRAVSDNFGCSVALNGPGNILSVGSYYADISTQNEAGAVYIFQ